jgi:subtilisin family serine protease
LKGERVSIRSRASLLLASLLVLVVAAPAVAAGPLESARRAADARAFDGRLIVVWKGEAPRTLHLSGVASTSRMERPMRSVVVARPGRAADVAHALRADARVLAVVPDARLSLLDWPADGDPSDTHYAEQGDLAQIGVPEAWKTTRGDASVVVAVIDSGVDLTHPDLDGVAVVDPRNMVWNNADVSDEVGHGTHVMGTIVAETNNGEGIAGIAPDSTLMPIKIADDSGYVAFSDVLDGVDWAREHGADVINMSLGGPLTVEQVSLGQPTFTAARDADILMVAAAGNDATRIRMYPASFAGVVSVSAVDATDTIAEFSNTGRAVDIAAPGVDLISTIPDGEYELGTGTSMASPHVAGVAALVRAARPGLDATELEAVLRASAVDLGDAGHDPVYGDGRVDAAAALAEPVPDPIPGLDPPAPFPALTIAFLAPAAKVTQTASTFTVQLDVNHEVVDSIALQGSWAQTNGHCKSEGRVRVKELVFAPTIELKSLDAGRCYQVFVAAVDEDFNYSEAISHVIKILDLTAPTIVHRTPAAGRKHVSLGANVEVRFSEPVVLKGTPVVLRNAHSGKVVPAILRWNAKTRTLTLDPVARLHAQTRYRVDVGMNVVDRGGNHLAPDHWGFVTGP